MIYKMTIAPQGSIGTPFRSDTLFGHACWAMKMYESEERFEEFLNNARDQKPELIFSDGFPSGFLPKPLLPMAYVDYSTADELREHKKNNKQKWISLETMGQEQWSFEKKLLPETKNIPNEPFEKARFHNVIDRITGFTSENALFLTNEQWYCKSWEKIDIYIYSEWEKEKLNTFVEKLFSVGYGKDQTTGSGEVKIINNPKPIEVPSYDTPYFLTLSRLIPDDSIVLENSFYDIEAKYGKIWSGLSPINPFKKPIMQILPGSVVKLKTQKAIAGRVLENIADDSRVIENCFSILYPLPSEVIDE